jgi:hypothetical protein
VLPHAASARTTTTATPIASSGPATATSPRRGSPRSRERDGAQSAVDDLDRAAQGSGRERERGGSLGEPADQDEQLVDRDVVLDGAGRLGPREDPVHRGAQRPRGLPDRRRDLTPLSDERDERELGRARIDHCRHELAERLVRIEIAGELDGLLIESVEVADEGRLDELLLGREVTKHRGDADTGQLGDILSRAARPVGAEHGLGRGQNPFAVGQRGATHRFAASWGRHPARGV